MNKTLKIIIAILGGFNAVVSMFLPIGLSLLLVKVYGMSGLQLFFIISIGFMASIFRSIKIAGFDTIDFLIKKFIQNKE